MKESNNEKVIVAIDDDIRRLEGVKAALSVINNHGITVEFFNYCLQKYSHLLVDATSPNNAVENIKSTASAKAEDVRFVPDFIKADDARTSFLRTIAYFTIIDGRGTANLRDFREAIFKSDKNKYYTEISGIRNDFLLKFLRQQNFIEVTSAVTFKIRDSFLEKIAKNINAHLSGDSDNTNTVKHATIKRSTPRVESITATPEEEFAKWALGKRRFSLIEATRKLQELGLHSGGKIQYKSKYIGRFLNGISYELVQSAIDKREKLVVINGVRR